MGSMFRQSPTAGRAQDLQIKYDSSSAQITHATSQVLHQAGTVHASLHSSTFWPYLHHFTMHVPEYCPPSWLLHLFYRTPRLVITQFRIYYQSACLSLPTVLSRSGSAPTKGDPKDQRELSSTKRQTEYCYLHACIIAQPAQELNAAHDAA